MLLLPALLIGLAIQCLLGSLFGAVILRAACAIYNRLFGGAERGVGSQPSEIPIASEVVPSAGVSSAGVSSAVAEPEELPVNVSPYASPVVALNRAYPEGLYYKQGVPSPDFGKAFLICLIVSLVQSVIGVFTGLALGFMGVQDGLFLVANAGLALFGFLILAMVVQVQLPTSFGRALGVAGAFFLISLAIGLSLFLIVFLVVFAFGTLS